jgi:hypothetical protein
MANDPDQIVPFDAKKHLADVAKFPEVKEPRNH